MPIDEVGSMIMLKEKRITCVKALSSLHVLHVELEK